MCRNEVSGGLTLDRQGILTEREEGGRGRER